MIICERGEWILLRSYDPRHLSEGSLYISHDCEARAKACWPGGMLIYPPITEMKCNYCNEQVPADIEAMYHVGNL